MHFRQFVYVNLFVVAILFPNHFVSKRRITHMDGDHRTRCQYNTTTLKTLKYEIHIQCRAAPVNQMMIVSKKNLENQNEHPPSYPPILAPGQLRELRSSRPHVKSATGAKLEHNAMYRRLNPTRPLPSRNPQPQVCRLRLRPAPHMGNLSFELQKHAYCLLNTLKDRKKKITLI